MAILMPLLVKKRNFNFGKCFPKQQKTQMIFLRQKLLWEFLQQTAR